MPTLGDEKPCILAVPADKNAVGIENLGCEGTMIWSVVHPPDAAFVGDNAARPDPIPDYEAWVCDKCGIEAPE